MEELVSFLILSFLFHLDASCWGSRFWRSIKPDQPHRGEACHRETVRKAFTMDCDQVFRVLTSGPFPTGTEIDHLVEDHLLTCQDCRSLGEALRPAPELFHESLTPSENRGLPIFYATSISPTDWLPSAPHQIASKRSMQAILERPIQSSRSVPLVRKLGRERWNHIVSSDEVGRHGDITTVVTFVSLLAIAMFSIGWMTQ